jgi:hypothetical protein
MRFKNETLQNTNVKQELLKLNNRHSTTGRENKRQSETNKRSLKRSASRFIRLFE